MANTDNYTASKADELKALEKIEKIIADLGPGSYLSLTFEHCAELARENIEFDMGCSWYDKAQSEHRQVEQLERDIQEMRRIIGQYETENLRQDHELERLRKELASVAAARVAERNQFNDVLVDLTIEDDDLTDLIQFVEDRKTDAEADIEAANETILEYADTPEDITFTGALRARKNARAELEYLQQLLGRLAGIQAAKAKYMN